MRYAQVTPFEVCNGKGVGVSLFVQGCRFQCDGCFNSEAWNFNGGKEWTEEIRNKFLKSVMNPHIKRVTFLGGEPLADENVEEVLSLIKTIRDLFKNEKKVWLYTGYTWEQIFPEVTTDDFNIQRVYRQEIVELCDVLVDGKYVDELRDVTLPFKGSSNQRLIDVQKTLKDNEVALYI